MFTGNYVVYQASYRLISVLLISGAIKTHRCHSKQQAPFRLISILLTCKRPFNTPAPFYLAGTLPAPHRPLDQRPPS